MADFVFSGGCRWNDLCAVDVKVGADGTPISCKNPITGAEISGGADAYTLSYSLTEAAEAPTQLIISQAPADAADPTDVVVVFNIGIATVGPHTVLLPIPTGTDGLYIEAADGLTITGEYEEVTFMGATCYKLTGDCAVVIDPDVY